MNTTTVRVNTVFLRSFLACAHLQLCIRNSPCHWDGPTPQFPNVHFVGYKFGEELAEYYAASDVFVFPSKSDTFGLVILEDLASGLPIAAYPVTGPKDIVTSQKVGFLSDDLKQSIEYAYDLKKDDASLVILFYPKQE